MYLFLMRKTLNCSSNEKLISESHDDDDDDDDSDSDESKEEVSSLKIIFSEFF